MQTVNEARYTFWHTVVEIWQASGKQKDEWCWENKISLKTFVHYEGIFRRQKARGYNYRKPEEKSTTTEPVQLSEKDQAETESPYVEIPMLDVAAESEQAMEGRDGLLKTESFEPEDICAPARPDRTELVIQAGGCRVTLGGDITEARLQAILKAVSGDA